MNRFSTNDNHKLGNMFYDTSRQLNINRLVSQNIEHKPIINPNVCCELRFNPYTQYDLHCKASTCLDSIKQECECVHVEEEKKEEHNIALEHIYNDSLTVHKFDINEERNKMRRDLLKNKERQKMSIKDFMKKA